MTKLFAGLPVATFYIPPITGDEDGNGKSNIVPLANNPVQQQLEKKQLDERWKNDPSFAGMPGHHLDENYQPRKAIEGFRVEKPTSDYVDPDLNGDQP
jgi:hypothetical protein